MTPREEDILRELARARGLKAEFAEFGPAFAVTGENNLCYLVGPDRTDGPFNGFDAAKEEILKHPLVP